MEREVPRVFTIPALLHQPADTGNQEENNSDKNFHTNPFTLIKKGRINDPPFFYRNQTD